MQQMQMTPAESLLRRLVSSGKLQDDYRFTLVRKEAYTCLFISTEEIKNNERHSPACGMPNFFCGKVV